MSEQETVKFVEQDEQLHSNQLVISNKAVGDLLTTVKSLQAIAPADQKFLMEHKEHLGLVLKNTYIWRTEIQKASILNDMNFPTIHSKFHQAILEMKVQFEQSMYLAKDFAMKQIEIEETECDLEELDPMSKRDQIKRKKIEIELQYKMFELSQMQIAMNYRMKEVKGWQVLQDDLLKQMRDAGMDEQTIWDKDEGELKSMFFIAINNLHGLQNGNSPSERNNMLSLATFVVKQAHQANVLQKFYAEADPAQKDFIKQIAEGFVKIKLD